MRPTAIFVLVCILTNGAVGQETPAAQPGSVLAGPKVTAPEQKKTLAHRDMEGRVVRLETRPEAAALDLLTLTPEERSAVDKVLTERAALVSKTLFDNIELFLKVQNARQAGAKEEMPALMRQFREATSALFEPPLVEKVEAGLPEGRRAEFRGYVKEYMTALAEDQENRAMNEDSPGEGERVRRGPDAGFAGGVRRAEMNLTVRELARALSSVVAERRERTEGLFKAVSATPEQESKITAILRGPDSTPGRLPSEEKRGEIMRKIMDVLTPEQRKLAAEYFRKN